MCYTITYLSYLNNLLVPLVKKPNPNDHEFNLRNYKVSMIKCLVDKIYQRHVDNSRFCGLKSDGIKENVVLLRQVLKFTFNSLKIWLIIVLLGLDRYISIFIYQKLGFSAPKLVREPCVRLCILHRYLVHNHV